MISVFVVFLVLSAVNASSNSSELADHQHSRAVCALCEDVLVLIDHKLIFLEKLTDGDLGSLVDFVCDKVPRSVPIVDAFCVVLREDFVAALTKIVQGLRAQISPKNVCSIIPSCKY